MEGMVGGERRYRAHNVKEGKRHIYIKTKTPILELFVSLIRRVNDLKRWHSTISLAPRLKETILGFFEVVSCLN